jgi:hypothetical protein
MLNNKHISKCIYSAEVIAYLYGEIAEKEKSAFETHVADCSNCTDELADFAFARFSVQEWRDAEFAHLETPVIKIPFERKSDNITDSAVSDSWLARLRGLVSLSPAWATAGGALAVLVIGLGLVLAAINIFQPAEVAELNNNSAKIAVSPTTEIIVQNPEKVFADNQNIKSSPEQSLSSRNKDAELIQPADAPENKKSGSSKNTIAKISENGRNNKSAKQFSENAPANNRAASKTADKTLPAKARQVPGLVAYEEDEDKTLRLAELFDEFDTDK